MPLIDPRQIKNGTALLTRIEELERKRRRVNEENRRNGENE